MIDKIEVRETYFRMPDGSVTMLRQIGERLEWHGKVPVILVDWARGGWPWESAWRAMPDSPDLAGKYFFEPNSFCRALVKEGPKAIVRWTP